MTEQVRTELEEQRDRYFTLKLLLTVALAFCAALIFRRSMGIWAMTPLTFTICLGAAFISISPKLKIAIFALSVFALNTVEQQDITVTLIHTALCLLACIAFEYAAGKLKRNKKLAVALLALAMAVCIFASFLLIGNPLKAFKIQKQFNEHIESNYPYSENAALGNFEFSRIYYNYRTGAYASSGVSSRFPTENAELTFGGNVLNDGVATLMEQKLAEDYTLEMTLLLRELFPNDTFRVEYDSVAGLPGKALFSSAQGELNESMNYIITLGGIQGAKEMRDVTEKYLNAIDKSGVGYGRIIFRSGIGFWYRRSITVEGDHFAGHANLELRRDKLGASTEFNRFITKTIEKDLPEI